MFNSKKTNNDLGIEVNKYLVEKGVETPMKDQAANVTDQKTIDSIQELYAQIMELQGLDLTDDSLMDTPFYYIVY